MKKFNKFDLVYESALKRLIKEENAVDSYTYSNGIRIGTNFRLKPSFFTQSEACKVLTPEQLKHIKALNSKVYENDHQHFFKVKTDSREMAGPNMKGANDINTALQEYGVISGSPEYKDDPHYKFMIASVDLKHVDVCDFGANLPPVLSPENPYSHYNAEGGRPKEVKDDAFVGLGNSPTNRSLPTQNRKL